MPLDVFGIKNNPDLFLRSLQFMEESLPSKLLIQQFEDFEEKNSDLYDYFSDYLIRIGEF